MKKKPRLLRRDLVNMVFPLLGRPFTLPGNDQDSPDHVIVISHHALGEAIELYLKGAFDGEGVANILRSAADQVDAHTGGVFDLAGREDAEPHRELESAHMILDAAINERLGTTDERLVVGNWLRDAADAIEAQKPISRALADE